MSDLPAKASPSPTDGTLTTTESLAVAQTRRQILEVLDAYSLRELRTEFMVAAPDGATTSEMMVAVVNLKRSIVCSDIPERDDIIERIDVRTVLPSSRPPRPSLL